MLPVTVTAERKRRTWYAWRKRRTWKRQLPEQWSEVPERRRRMLYRLALQGHKAELLQRLLRLPRWAIDNIPPEQRAALLNAVAWMEPRADCDHLPWPYFEHRGRRYYFPKPKGENMTCMEYPLADEYYLRFVQEGDESALLLLVATLCREESNDRERYLAEDDHRVALRSRAEVIERATVLRHLDTELQMAVLLFFAGLKEYVHRVYGQHIFEPDEDEEVENVEEVEQVEKDEEYEAYKKRKQADTGGGEGFGWWGALQDVAEAGLFGNMKEVWQASFHEVCMWMVRQRIKERQMRSQIEQTKRSL